MRVTLPGLTVMALVPNLRGAEAALAAGVHKLTMPVSASAAHSLANVRKTREEMVERCAPSPRCAATSRRSVQLEAGISTAFGCTMQGEVPEDEVIRLAAQCVAAGADESGLSDTVGYANPAQVRRLFTRLRAELGDKAGAAHMHNTRGLGLANCLAAYEEGVRTFDASLGGLGGCPYAPGASGNVVTEDLVFMFEAMGVAHRHRPRQADRGARAAHGRPARRAGLRHDARGRLAQGLRPGSRPCLNPSTPALRRHPRRRIHPHGDGPDLRHAAGRPRRRGHQGRADRRRRHAPRCSAPAPASSRPSTATRRASRSTSRSPRAWRPRCS